MELFEKIKNKYFVKKIRRFRIQDLGFDLMSTFISSSVTIKAISFSLGNETGGAIIFF